MIVRIDTVRWSEPRPVRVLNSYLGVMYDTVDEVQRSAPAATVDGVPWTVEQTAQALRDSRLCKCGQCACCLIAKAEHEARRGA